MPNLFRAFIRWLVRQNPFTGPVLDTPKRKRIEPIPDAEWEAFIDWQCSHYPDSAPGYVEWVRRGRPVDIRGEE